MWAVHRLQHEAVEELVVGHHAIGADDLAAGALVDRVAQVRRDGLEAREDFAAGAVFRQNFGHRLVFEDGRELRLLVIRKMARGLVELELADVRREHL